MNRLPDEVIILIFDLLPTKDLLAKVALVCRRWASLVEHRAMVIKKCNDLQRLHPALVSLRVTACLQTLRPAFYFIPWLRELTVDVGIPFGEKDIMGLALLPQIRHLDIFTKIFRVDGQMLAAAKKLNTLVVNETIVPGFLRGLSESNNLSSLHMYGRSLHFPRPELFPVMIARREYLTELTLRCQELTDKFYVAIGVCRNLHTLRLYSCWMMTAAGVMQITKLPLQCLHLTGTRMVRKKALAVFLENLPVGITDLVLSASWMCPDHTVALVSRLPKLKALELWRCRVPPAPMVSLAMLLPHLESLDIDLVMEDQYIYSLQKHPTLKKLRCLPESRPFKGKLGYRLKVIRADKKSESYFRDSGEGYQAGKFYYWT